MGKGLLVITGGASGIGLACAKAMANEYEGVILVDINSGELLAAKNKFGALGISVHSYECDVADHDAQAELADKIEREIGNVDTLITSAGILNNSETVMNMDLREHARVWDVNYNVTDYSFL